MSDPGDTSPPRSGTSTTAAVSHEDDFCERRRQQNREAQRRFRNKKNKEREAAATTTSAPTRTPAATPNSATLPRSNDPTASPQVPTQGSASLTLPADLFPPAGDLDLYSVLAYPSATSNHDSLDAHDYFGHGSYPEVDALLAPYHVTTGDESTLFAATSNIVSPQASFPPFDTLQHPSYSFAGLDSNSTAAENFGLDALFGRHSRGHSMGDQDFGWNPHSQLATPRRVLEDLPASRPTRTASAESMHPAPSSILPGLRPHPDDQRRTKSSQPNCTATAAPPTPASSRKHTPLPTQAPSPSDSVDSKPLLHISIDSGHQGVVRTLLDSGVDVNERDGDGSTALHLAVQMRQDAIIRLLLERGALTNLKDTRGKTPTHLAIYSNFETGLKILLDHDANREKRI